MSKQLDAAIAQLLAQVVIEHMNGADLVAAAWAALKRAPPPVRRACLDNNGVLWVLRMEAIRRGVISSDERIE
jgi:hypothetical protein